jgi:hypothetical protein
MNLLRISNKISDVIFSPFANVAAKRFSSRLHVPSCFLVQLLTIEDKRFLVHPGVDPIALVRAGFANLIEKGTLQGASTITQQLYDARRELKGTKRNRTLYRKVRQAAWALCKDVYTSKYEVLSEYLNIVYWGRSYYGLDAAVSGYFNSIREHLTVAQSFFLAERLARPNTVAIRRIIALLARPSISSLFFHNESAVVELIAIYNKHFQCGGELCQSLVKSPKRSGELMSKFWSGVWNSP